MATLYRTLTYTTGSIAPAASTSRNDNLFCSQAEIVKITITPSSVSNGQLTTYAIYKHNTFLAADIVYSTSSFAGNLVDPIETDGITSTERNEGYVARYEDLDGLNQFHNKITNNALIARTFTVTITYLVVSDTQGYVNVKAFGATGDGSTDDAPAIQAALSSLTTGGVAYFPPGTYKPASTLIPTANTTCLGAGSATTIALASGKVGFGLIHNGFKLSSMAVTLADAGPTTRGIQFNAALSNVAIDQVDFIGNGSANENFALVINNFNLTNLRVTNSSFTGMASVIVKDSTDTSTTTNTVFDNLTLTDVGDGININHPLEPEVLGKTQGSWTQVQINNVTGDTSADNGWFIGISGQGVKQVEVTNFNSINSKQEAIHIEDDASGITLEGGSIIKQGTTVADHGLIQIINGASDISIHGFHFDMTSATDGVAGFGVNAEIGGGLAAPFALDITGNTFVTKGGNPAIQSADCYAVKLSNTYRNADTSDKAAYFVGIARSHVDSFHESFYNPAVLFSIDDNSFGVVTKPNIYAASGDLLAGTDFAFITGNTNDSTGILFNGFNLTRAYTAGSSMTNSPLFPAGRIFDGVVGLRFQSNGTFLTWVSTSKAFFTAAGPTLTQANQLSYSGISGGNISSVLTYDSGNICATSSGAGAGLIVVNFDGQYFPAV